MSRPIPGPPARWGGLDLARRFRQSPLDFLGELGRAYGDVAYFRIGPLSNCFVNHPELINQLLTREITAAPKSERLMAALLQIDGRAIATSEGDFWQRQRRLVQAAFHQQRMPGYASTMLDSARRRISEWTAGSEIDVQAEMTRLTLEIACKVMFSVDLDTTASHFAKAVHDFSEAFVRETGQPVMWPDWLPLPYKRRKRAAIATLDGFIRHVVRERRAADTDQGDLLSMLLLAANGEGNHPGMTDEQVRNEAMTLFNAGHDTTAAGLTWLLYVMADKPDVQERVTLDVRSTGQGELDRVIKETLRLYPPAFALFARESTREIILRDYPIPPRTTFFVSPYVLHHDSRFFERPEIFDPDRFRPERESSIPRFAYMPFGIGPHMCIGAGFATLEMRTVVTAILERFRLTLLQGPDGFNPLLSLLPRRPIIVRVDERDHRRVARGS